MKQFSIFKAASPLGSNVYFANTTPAVIIDTGHPSYAQQTLEIMQRSLPMEKVGYILCTHSHPDHLGAAPLLRNATPSKLCILPPENNNKLTSVHKREIKLDIKDVEFDYFLRGGEKILLDDEVIEIIHTPGHADDHCCLYFSQRQYLFTGDLITHEDTGFLNLNKSFQTSLNELKQSIDRCAKLTTRRVFPGHGDPYRCAPWDKLKRKLQLFEKNPQLLIPHTLISPILFYIWAKGKVSPEDCEQYIRDHRYLFDGFLEGVSEDLIIGESRKLLSLLELRDVISCYDGTFRDQFSKELQSQWYK